MSCLYARIKQVLFRASARYDDASREALVPVNENVWDDEAA